MLGQLMEHEIAEQPGLLQRVVTQYYKTLGPAISFRPYDMVLLAARGSSDNAAQIARYWIEVFAGIPVVLAAPSVITRFKAELRYRNCLAVGISQSGAAPDVAEVIASMREAGHLTVGITNTPHSRLVTEAEHVVLLDAGPERALPATKTYSCTLLALYQLVRCLTEMPPPDQFLYREDWLNRVKKDIEERAGPVVRCNPVFALGRSFSFGTAQECALKLMESALISCTAFSSADFEHGPKALAGAGSAAITFDGPKKDLAAQGCAIIESSKPPAEIPTPLIPLWDAVFAQMLALHVARARGLDPDGPPHLRKVTETL